MMLKTFGAAFVLLMATAPAIGLAQDQGEGLSEPARQSQPQAQSAAPTSGSGDFFGIDAPQSPMFVINEHRALLEQFNSVAALMREIKEQGNNDAVLSMLEAITNDPQKLAVIQAAFDKIEVEQDLPDQALLAAITQSRPAPVQGQPAPREAEPEPRPEPKPAPVPEPIIYHDVVPVFAQVAADANSRDKAIVSINGRRFIRLPGETIEVDRRVILIESVQSKVNAAGHEEYTIWIVENGKREALLWQ